MYTSMVAHRRIGLCQQFTVIREAGLFGRLGYSGDWANPAKPLRLLDRMRQIIRTKHYAYSTEQAYVHWVRRYILFHAKRHPKEMGGPEIERFLTHLAVEGQVSASTQTQALCALLFLYK